MRMYYRTVTGPAQIELEEKKSRFIAACRPLTDESEANAFVNGIRQQYPDATHHVYAWILGGDNILQRFSDDGEPQGTAGLPVLDVLRKQNIDQAGIVVTRYFGGTLLGTGGLVHAYGHSAAMALEAAGPVTMQLSRTFQVIVHYPVLDRLRHQLNLLGLTPFDFVYGADVKLKVAVPVDQNQQIIDLLTNITSGEIEIEPIGLGYRPLPTPDPPSP